MKPHMIRPVSAAAGVILGVLLTGGFGTHPDRLEADDKKAPEAFLSGGARSEKVLVEILATLRQIDARVAGIEETLKEAATSDSKAERNKQ